MSFMRPNKLLIIAFFLLFSISNYSQTSLIGKITNDKDEPVVNALVYLDTIKTKTTSNSIGFFKVEVQEGVKNITLHSKEYGYLTYAYNNEERLNFVFIESKVENKKAKNLNALNVSEDDNAATFNTIYAEYFSSNGPCRTTVEVNRLPTPIAIELKCVADVSNN